MKIKKLFRAGLRYLTNSNYRWLINADRGRYDNLPDEEYLKRKYSAVMKKALNLSNPQTFNEKLQWLKLYDRKPEYTMMADKYKVRDYIKEQLGEEYLIPLLGVWDSPDEIDFDALPNQFVLKCNHNSGLGMCICKDKSKLDIKKVKSDLKKGLAQDYYLTGREWPYKDIPRKIIAEKYMEDSKGELRDYKFFCFNGEADNVMIVAKRSTGNPCFYHFNKEWKLCQYNRLCRSLPENYTIPKPDTMDKMFELAEKLSKGIPHVRMDFYSVDNKVYFGEFTFFNQSGFETGFDNFSDNYLGDLVTLPNENIINTKETKVC